MKKPFTSPHHNQYLSSPCYPCIHQRNQFKNNYKKKRIKKQKPKKREKRKEEAYPKVASPTYHSINPFSTHFNTPSTSELRKM